MDKKPISKKALETIVVDFKKIYFGKKRFREDYTNIVSLKESILKKGVLQSLLVNKQEDGNYLLVAGGRRLIACQELYNEGLLETVPITICPPGLSMPELRSLELEENIQREDLTPMEQAALKKEIHETMISIHGEKVSKGPSAKGWSIRDTAELIGESHSNVAIDIELANMAGKMPELQKAKTKKEARRIMEKTLTGFKKKIVTQHLELQRDSGQVDVQKQKLIDAYIVGDFFKLCRKQVPTGSADLIELDPPFGIGIDDKKKLIDNDRSSLENYEEWKRYEYMEKIERTLRECWRILKKDGWLIFWYGLEPWGEPIYQACIKQGFKGRRLPGYWLKPTGQTQQPSIYLPNSIDPFYYFRKGEAKIQKSRDCKFIYSPISGLVKDHPTQKPIELMESIFSTFILEGSNIVIPFLGSGVGIRAASNHLSRVVGFDLSQEYKDSHVAHVWEGEVGKYRR